MGYCSARACACTRAAGPQHYVKVSMKQQTRANAYELAQLVTAWNILLRAIRTWSPGGETERVLILFHPLLVNGESPRFIERTSSSRRRTDAGWDHWSKISVISLKYRSAFTRNSGVSHARLPHNPLRPRGTHRAVVRCFWHFCWKTPSAAVTDTIRPPQVSVAPCCALTWSTPRTGSGPIRGTERWQAPSASNHTVDGRWSRSITRSSTAIVVGRVLQTDNLRTQERGLTPFTDRCRSNRHRTES